MQQSGCCLLLRSLMAKTKDESLSTTQQARPKWVVEMDVHSLRIILCPDAAVILWMVATSYSVYYTFQVAIPVIYDEIYH